MTVDEQLELLTTLNEVKVLIFPLGLSVDLKGRYCVGSPEEQEIFKKSKVSSIQVLKSNKVIIRGTYCKEEI